MKNIFKHLNYKLQNENIIAIIDIIFLICLFMVMVAFTSGQSIHEQIVVESDTITIQNQVFEQIDTIQNNIVSEQDIYALKYDSAKHELIKEVNNYIKKVAPHSQLDGHVVVKECLNNKIDICFVLAQGENESHFGTAGLARKTNSVWNVYAFDKHSYNNVSKNGKYTHPNHSVQPYIELLKNDYLVNGKTEYNLMHGKFVNKHGMRYASSKTYEKSLLNKYIKIKQSTKIYSLCQEINKYKNFLGN